MDRSLRRTTGKDYRYSGRSKAVIVITVITLSMTGYAAYESIIGQQAIVTALPDCIDHDTHSASESAKYRQRRCKPQPAAQNMIAGSPTSASPAQTPTPEITVNSTASAATSPLQNGYLAARKYDLQPGHTVVEWCGMPLDDSQFHCSSNFVGPRALSGSTVSRNHNDAPGTISGHVRNDIGEGLAGTNIVATLEATAAQTDSNNPDALRFWTKTDDTGAYRLDSLPQGEYLVRSSGSTEFGSARTMARSGDKDVDLLLHRSIPMVVTGAVTTADGAPLEGVTVSAMLLGQPSTLTDDDGGYALELHHKPSSRSLGLRFQRPGFIEQSEKFQLASDRAAPNGTYQTTLQRVVMDPVESWTALRGSVVNASGQPLPNRDIELRPTGKQHTHRTKTDGNGEFEIAMLEAPGNYSLLVSGGTTHQDHQQKLKLTSTTPTVDVILPHYEYGEVSGRLVDIHGVPVSHFDLVLRNAGSTQPNAFIETDRSGNFRIESVPAGQIIVASRTAPSIVFKGAYLEAGARLNLSLVMDWGRHEIHGAVIDRQGNPVAASRVALQWTYQFEGITTIQTRRAAADAMGQFSFRNLGPGPHSLRIDAPGHQTVNIEHDLERNGYDLTVRLN